MNQTYKHLAGRLLLFIVTIAILILLLFPFAVMVTTMLRPGTEIYLRPPQWIPDNFTLQNFVNVWGQYNLLNAFRSSLFIGVGSTLLNLVLAIPAAYAIARLRFRGRQLALYSALSIQMFSPIIVVISLFKIFASVKLIDTYTSLILSHTIFTLSASIWLLTGYFTSIPKEIEEAAWIDGYSRLATIRAIILPIAAPGVVTAMIYSFIWSWNEFLFALSFIKSQPRMPLTLAIFRFVGRWSTQWELLTAALLFALLPVLILFYFIERQLVAGLASDAVKQ